MGSSKQQLLRASLLALISVGLAGICNDVIPDCATWARNGECTGENAAHVTLTCPLSCGICTHSCNDTDASCPQWAKDGECESNPNSMLRICPTSCGICAPECTDVLEECTDFWPELTNYRQFLTILQTSDFRAQGQWL